MLATALDVYFSDPALGGNKINAPAAIGGQSIDLTLICKLADNSTTGTVTCSGAFGNVVTCGAFTSTPQTVSQLLAYSASQATAATLANPLASKWYGDVKSVQECAKNTFDSINNQVAFTP